MSVLEVRITGKHGRYAFLSLADSGQTADDLEVFLRKAFAGDETRLARCRPCVEAIVKAAGVGD